MKSLVFLLVFMIPLLLAFPTKRQTIQKPTCTGFRITFPVDEAGPWTDGECYQLSFDAGRSRGIEVTDVNLLDTDGNFIVNQWSGSIFGDATIPQQTPLFPLNLGPEQKSGDYLLALVAKIKDGDDTKYCDVPYIKLKGIFNLNNIPNTCLEI
ncbi:hypothetical protein G9A89_010460 [Geosiphon pyriformis]|nr:hypothetical protein G9A89_010460 [Geosiphon pyriformis]